MATPARTYTRSEKAKRARLLAKGAYNAYGDISKIEAQLDRIDAAAEDRAQREQAAHRQMLEGAKNELAAAKVRERAASRQDRNLAKDARKNAEKRLREVERAAR
jgi:hypothetical protein